jgi:hypothetical protein
MPVACALLHPSVVKRLIFGLVVVACNGGDPDSLSSSNVTPPATNDHASAPDAAPSADAGPVSQPLPHADAAPPPHADAAPPVDAGPPDDGPHNPPPPPGDPCYGVVCPAGQACVSTAHGQPLGVCVDTCDCSNCANCDYTAQDGRWNDMQEYCGNLNAQPATQKCNRPCSDQSQGCIYYGAVNICWPLEGCFSAP